MEQIIAPVSVELLKAELTPAKKLRDTNKSKNEIYVINHHDSPNVMREIARLREVTFREAGGGSGLADRCNALRDSTAGADRDQRLRSQTSE